jgi:hypothetical protein
VEVSGQLHSLTAFGWEALWISEEVWTRWWRNRSLLQPGSEPRFPIRPAHSLVTILAELPVFTLFCYVQDYLQNYCGLERISRRFRLTFILVGVVDGFISFLTFTSSSLGLLIFCKVGNSFVLFALSVCVYSPWIMRGLAHSPAADTWHWPSGIVRVHRMVRSSTSCLCMSAIEVDSTSRK